MNYAEIDASAKKHSDEECNESEETLKRLLYWERATLSEGWVNPYQIEGLLYMAERALALALERDKEAYYHAKDFTSEMVREFSEDVAALTKLALKYPRRGQVWVPQKS